MPSFITSDKFTHEYQQCQFSVSQQDFRSRESAAHLTLTDFWYANCCRDIERWKAGTPGTRPLSVLLVGDEHDLIVDDALQMPVGALAITLSGLHELAARDPTVLERDLPHDCDGQALSALHGTHDPLPITSTNSWKAKHCQSPAQAAPPSALTLPEFRTLGRIPRNILSN